MIAGYELTGGRTVAAVWDAPGLTGWQRAAIALPATGDSQLNAVTATGKGFVAVGSAGDPRGGLAVAHRADLVPCHGAAARRGGQRAA